jgi:signal transduction histidine kinase
MRFVPTPAFVLSAVVIFFLCYAKAHAQQVFVLGDTATIHRLDKHTEVLIDTSGILSFDNVSKDNFQHKFRHLGQNLTFGYEKAPIWLKVKLQPASVNNQWFLEIPAPFLEYVDFYQSSDDTTWHHSRAGYYRPYSIRETPHTAHVLPLHFVKGLTTTVYIRVAGSCPKTFPLYAIEKEYFNEKIRLQDLGYGVFFGMLIVMFFYNLFIFLTLRQTNYLLYICTILCTIVIFSSATGYAGKYVWPENPEMNLYAGRLSLGVLAVFLSAFTIRFLEVKHYSRFMYYVLLCLIPLGVVSMILIATKTVSSAGNNLITVATVAYMITGVVCSIRGNKTAYYFIAAWTVYLIGGLLLTLRNSGVLDFNFWTTHFVEIGAGLETMIIAFALGDRYRRYEMEKEEVQLLALRVQQDATEKLEIKVKNRTEELSKANKELSATLQKNKLQTKIIEDKNAELDSFFYRISHDIKGPIASLLGLSFLAKREIKDERALEYISKQHQQTERLNTIITGLIKLTKLNHHELPIEKIDFDQMIGDCILSFSNLPNFEHVAFKREVDPDITFFSEWNLLNAIIQNLIENAIKYARHDSPYVHIIVRKESRFVVIEVTDNGQGIPHEHHSRIFEIFYRATQHATGSGLGLYILKRSVDKLNGTIDIKSEVGVGSTFTVKLPVPTA